MRYFLNYGNSIELFSFLLIKVNKKDEKYNIYLFGGNTFLFYSSDILI